MPISSRITIYYMFDFTKHGKTLEGFGWNDRECLTIKEWKSSHFRA